MSYDPHVVNAILRIGRRRGESKRYILEAFATGIVESGLRNLSGGDADSAGWRQERASIYSNPTNLTASINRFFDELHQHDHGQKPGWLSADVQRPAEQYRGRYAEAWGQAKAILSGKGYDVSGVPSAGGGEPSFTPGAPAQNPRAKLFSELAQFNKNTLDPNNPIEANLQKGWDLLAQLASQGKPVQSGLPSQLGMPTMPGGGVGGGKFNRLLRNQLHEAFYNPVGDYDEGKPIGAVEGHDTHAHFGGNPRVIAAIVRRAQKRGLAIREYAPVDPVEHVHAQNSWHYRFGGRGGVDISGDQRKLAAFFRRITRRAGYR